MCKNVYAENNNNENYLQKKEKAPTYIMRQEASKDAIKFISVEYLLLGK